MMHEEELKSTHQNLYNLIVNLYLMTTVNNLQCFTAANFIAFLPFITSVHLQPSHLQMTFVVHIVRLLLTETMLLLVSLRFIL